MAESAAQGRGMASKPRPSAKVAVDVERALAERLDDEALRSRLEALALEPGFAGLTALWGPALYRRNRVLFRPFLLARFSSHDPTRGWTVVPWKGRTGTELEGWLAKLDEDGDVELFRRVYEWKLAAAGFRSSAKTWRQDLLLRFGRARGRAERQRVLLQFDLPFALDEATAEALHAADAEASRAFLLRHLPRGFFFGETKREPWRRLWEAARKAGDEELLFTLYRRQVGVEEWRKDALDLCSRVPDAGKLCEELSRRHPEGWLKGVGPVFVDVLRERERDVFPYVVPRLRSLARAFLFGRDGYGDLVKLSEEKGWVDLWAATVRTCGKPEEFDAAVSSLVADRRLGEDEVERRLLALAGVSQEWNLGPLGVAAVHSLTEPTAVALYGRFPGLVRGPFRLHVGRRWGRTYRDLLAEALKAEDEDLVDSLASREVFFLGGPQEDARGRETRERLADHYSALEGAAFARRAAAALGQVPAFSVYDYGRVVRENRLARLLFERSLASYLEQPAVLRDLLEAPEIHVQALAFRTLALPEDRARDAAASCLDLLVPALLRPLHRRTRLLALAALENAVRDEAAAGGVVARAREAFALPDRRYPKEALVGLLGRLLHRFPALRSPAEEPVVHLSGGAT